MEQGIALTSRNIEYLNKNDYATNIKYVGMVTGIKADTKGIQAYFSEC